MKTKNFLPIALLVLALASCSSKDDKKTTELKEELPIVEVVTVGQEAVKQTSEYTGTVEAFQRFTNDMVGPALQLPATLGLSAPNTNNCDLKTVGWELNFSWRDRTSFDGTLTAYRKNQHALFYYGLMTRQFDSTMKKDVPNEFWKKYLGVFITLAGGK